MPLDIRSKVQGRLAQHPRWSAAVPVVLGLLVRLLGIDSRPIWYDEAFAVLFSEKGPQAMLVGTLSLTSAGAADVHPLGYYALLWAWMGTFGESLVSVRALSVLASLATIVVVYFLAFELFGFRPAMAAGVIAALSPFQAHYGQEIRMYAFLGLWLALATYCCWRGTQSQRWLWWAGFSVFAAAAQYTHNLAAFYLLSLALWPLLRRDWRALKRVVIAASASVVLYLPWLMHLPAQLSKISQAYWIEQPGAYRLLTLLLVYVTNMPVRPSLLAVALTSALLLSSMALLQTIRAARADDVQWLRAAWLLYLAFSAPLLMFLVSQWMPVYVERALLPSGIAFCIWVAWALMGAQVRRLERVLIALMLGAGVVIGMYEHLTYAGFPYAPYRELAQDFRLRLQEGDRIVHSSKLSMLPLVYFDRELNQAFVADPPNSDVDTLAASTQRVLGLKASPDITSAAGNATRVWFILFAKSNLEYTRAGYPAHPQLTWLKTRYVPTDVQHWGDLDVYLFSREK